MFDHFSKFLFFLFFQSQQKLESVRKDNQIEQLNSKIYQNNELVQGLRDEIDMLINFPEQYCPANPEIIQERSINPVQSDQKEPNIQRSMLDGLLGDLQSQIKSNCYRIEYMQHHNHKLQRSVIKLLQNHGYTGASLLIDNLKYFIRLLYVSNQQFFIY